MHEQMVRSLIASWARWELKDLRARKVKMEEWTVLEEFIYYMEDDIKERLKKRYGDDRIGLSNKG